jgi:laminin alpha 3/5
LEVSDGNGGGTDKVVQIAKWQPELKWNIPTKNGGKHVLAVVYFTPEPTNGTSISVAASQGEGAGEAYIFDCPYTTLCRQVVTDPQGRLVEFDLTAPSTTIAIRAMTPDTNVAIDRIVLIPLDQWTADFITPMAGCVKDRLGQCRLPGPFAVPPEGSAILLPVNEELLYKGPPPRGMADPETPLIRLDASQPAVNLSGEIAAPGTFVIIAQYYQPDHPRQEVQVIINQGGGVGGGYGDGESAVPPEALSVYEAILPLPNCPSATGCRQAVLRQPGDGQPAEFPLAAESLDIQFKISGDGKGAWIEYALAVPTEEYDPSLLAADTTVDRGGEFIKECGRNAYYVPENIADGFCKAAVTSVAAAFNDGAFECKCHAEGSLNPYACAPFGGQCECRPNVIGRACERCAPGYFGFPECKQCKCPPTATCNEATGECICAPFVTGTEEAPCSQCEENTFGYDPITGCQECNCMIEGTQAGQQAAVFLCTVF